MGAWTIAMLGSLSATVAPLTGDSRVTWTTATPQVATGVQPLSPPAGGERHCIGLLQGDAIGVTAATPQQLSPFVFADRHGIIVARPGAATPSSFAEAALFAPDVMTVAGIDRVALMAQLDWTPLVGKLWDGKSQPEPKADPKKEPAKPAPAPAPAPAAQPVSPPTTPPAPPPAAQPEKKPEPTQPDLPSLDDLLGTGDKTKPGDTTKPVDPLDPNSADLDRLLSGAELGDAFKQAVTMMGDVSKRLKDSKDASLTTQRVQESIVRRLDQLLSSLEQQQQQQQSSSSQQQQQQQDQKKNVPQQQQKQDQQNQENPGDNQGQVVEPPGRRDAPIRPGLESARSAWGKLPDRVRDLLVQGSSDRFSSMYEAMTEAYYKKLAEQGKAR